MLRKCCIPGCESSSDYDIILHKIPVACEKVMLWYKSISAVGITVLDGKPWNQLSKLFVCHKHFEPRFVSNKKRLVADARPTLFTREEMDSGNPMITTCDKTDGVTGKYYDHEYAKKSKHNDHSYSMGESMKNINFPEMAPNTHERDLPMEIQEPAALKSGPKPRDYEIAWTIVAIQTTWHIAALYGLYLSFTSAMWTTLLFNVVIYIVEQIGVTAGAHRLWSHRTYKAKLPLQIMLMLFHTMAWHKSVFHWARDHRLHHKYSDTDADPHNPSRGFFYAHLGWLLTKKHPDVIAKSKTIDMSDMLENPVLQFQKKHYTILSSLLVFILPAVIPVYFWNETLNIAHHVSLLRLLFSAHVIYAINSVAHFIGGKPYDKNITATQSLTISFLLLGEGYHNYHHVFPFDYRVSEFGNRYLNLTTLFINFCVWFGWAYDLKYATDDMIEKRMKRTGDGTDLWGKDTGVGGTDINAEPIHLWGWGDTDMPEEDKKAVGI